jgi:hypothetical protein
VKVCLKCVKERHKEHEVIGYAKLKTEAKRVEKELVQMKRGDILSIKQIREEVINLRNQLNNSITKHKEELKFLITSILSNAYEVSKEVELHTTRLRENLGVFEDSLQSFYYAQEEEVRKLPEVANAVITQGTTADLRIFFEMCKDGIGINTELLGYKSNVDSIKSDVEEFIISNSLITTIKQCRILHEQLNNKEHNNAMHSLNEIVNEFLDVNTKERSLMNKRPSVSSSLLSTSDESSLHIDSGCKNTEHLKGASKRTISMNGLRSHRRVKSIPNNKVTQSQTNVLKVSNALTDNKLKDMQNSIHTLHDDYKRFAREIFGVASEYAMSIRRVINSVNNIKEAYTNTKVITEEIQRMAFKGKDKKSISKVNNNNRQIIK